MKYKSHFDIKGDQGLFVETFKNTNTGSVRKNEHVFYMENMKQILNKAKKVGFIVDKRVNMSKCMYDAQYIYILKKP